VYLLSSGFGDAAAMALSTPLVLAPVTPPSATQSALADVFMLPYTAICKVLPAGAQGTPNSFCSGGLGLNAGALVVSGLVWAGVAFFAFGKGGR
jgi:hypothetical protein